ncbi:MAG: hypothetical protein ACRC1K_15160, partial [Planctomycetia bacterium]
LAVFVPPMITAALTKPTVTVPGLSRAEVLSRGWQSGRVVRLALLGGAAMLACMAYLLEGRAWMLAVAGAPVAAMLIGFPSKASLSTWLAAQGAGPSNDRDQF